MRISEISSKWFSAALFSIAGIALLSRAFAADPAQNFQPGQAVQSGHSVPTVQNPGSEQLGTPDSNSLVDPSAPSNSSTSGGGAQGSIFAGFMDPFDYDPRGRRDPFSQPIADQPATQGELHGPVLPLQRFDLTQLSLVGIIWDVRRPKAMIRDPEGKTHIVGPNTKIGPRNGYIAVIREGEMVVVETVDQAGKLFSTAQVVKIAR